MNQIPFERSSCDCRLCELPCHSMPGTVAPSDLVQIANYMEEPLDDEFLQEYFQASDGPIAKKEVDGQEIVFQIPTIVPKLTEHGCVFLKAGRCTIHPVSPFGCAYYQVCVEDKDWPERSTW